jgi:hypothetical protein
MAVEEYDSMHHMRRDVHEAHSDAKVAKLLSTLALIGAVLSLALAVWALDKAGQAQSDSNRAVETVQRAQ